MAEGEEMPRAFANARPNVVGHWLQVSPPGVSKMCAETEKETSNRKKEGRLKEGDGILSLVWRDIHASTLAVKIQAQLMQKKRCKE